MVRTFVKLDFSTLVRALRGDAGLPAAAKTISALALMVVFVGAVGVLPAAVIATNPDPWMGGSVLSLQISSFTALLLLANHAGTLVTPQDHGILGFRPVTSRTYLAVRITTLFAHTLPFVTVVATAPLLMLLLQPAATIAAVLAGIVIVYGSLLATTLALVAGYSWILRFAGPRRSLYVVTTAQVVAAFVSIGGFVVLSDDDARRFIMEEAMRRDWWAIAIPGSWFGSYLELASGAWDGPAIVAAAASVLFCGGIGAVIGGKLSLRYAGDVAHFMARSGPPAARSVWVPRALADELRVTAILVRSQFKNDLKFRLGVLGLLPISAIVFVIGWRSGHMPQDPFVETGFQNSSMMIQMVVFFIPEGLRRTLVTSDAYRAAWVFHTAPADLTRLVLSAPIMVTVMFLIPYVVLLAIVLSFLFGHPGHAIVHAAFLGWMAYVVLQLGVLMDPKLPFSSPPQPTSAGQMFGFQMLVMLGGSVVYAMVTLIAYRSLPSLLIMGAALLVATMALNRLTRRRVERDAGKLRYD